MARAWSGSCSVLIALSFAAASAQAVSFSYTDESSFLGAVPGGSTGVLDFESLAGGTILSGATVTTAGSHVTGITFPNEIVDPLGAPLDTLDLMVVADTGDNPTSSGSNSLGADDAGNFDLITATAVIDLIFTSPVNAFGLTVVTPDEPGVFLFDEDIQLVVPGATSALLSLGDGSLLGNFGGSDYYGYFLGVVSDTPFSAASLDYDASVPSGGAFFFNVDDMIVAVPEPNTLVLVSCGLVGMLMCRRRPAEGYDR